MSNWSACLVLLLVLAASALSGQTALTTPDIPGIVAGGTPVILVKAGLNSAEGPVAAPDGSLYFTEPSDNKIYRVDADDNITVLFDRGDELTVQAGGEGIRFLLVSGKPLHEPVAWYGPIVMNTQQQLREAFEELERGTFLKTHTRG